MTDAYASAPEGIQEDHERPIVGWRRHASPFSLAAFGVVLVLGLTGVLGHERTWTATANRVELRVHAPEVIRNGEFFEIRVHIQSEDPIGTLVIGVDATLWEDMTVNTMIPASTDESSEDGELLFDFPALEPGTAFLWKVDLQVNPDIVLGNEGTITVYDADDPLVETDVSINVLP